MNKFVLFVLAALLPVASATPQAMSYANPSQVMASGFVTIGFGNGFNGVKSGNSNCNGFNDTFGSYLTTQGNNSQSMVSSLGFRCMISLSGGGSYDLRVGLSSAAIAQNYFSYVRVIDCAGATRIYTSATATYANTGGPSFNAIWTWGSGSSPVMVSPCAGTPILITFFR